MSELNLKPNTEITEKLFYTSAGDFISIVHCLQKISDVNAYKKWMKDYHDIRLDGVYFAGYKLIFNTLLRMLCTIIEDGEDFDLKADDIFYRARFRGIYIQKLPNSSERTIVIKNLVHYASDASNARSWQGFSKSIGEFSSRVLTQLARISKISRKNPKYNLSDLETAINYLAMFNTYIFLNDTSRGLPHGYVASMIDEDEIIFGFRKKTVSKLANAFAGYKYGIEYLWYQLLGNKFEDSIVSKLHEASNWKTFDEYFNKIQKEINQIERQAGATLGLNPFILITKSPKYIFKVLLATKPKELALSSQEQLKRIFLWYPIQLINCYDYDFAGVPVLVPLLRGMVIGIKSSKDSVKIKVIRLIHGKAEDHRRDYSYAVLVGLRGVISDASGWILFYDCCSDRGSTSGLYLAIEKELNKYQRSELLDVQTIRIDKDSFIKMMQGEIVLEGVQSHENPQK